MLSDPEEQRTRLNTYLLCCGFTGAILFGLINFALAAVTPEYVIVRQPIGDLELLHHGWIQSVDFILFGLFTWAFAIGLRMELRAGVGAPLLPLCHELMAAGLILAGIFVRNPIHMIAAFVIFLSMVASMLLFAFRFKNDARWNGWALYTAITGLLMFVLFILFWYSISRHGRYTGLLERFPNILRGVWLAIFTIRIAAGVRLNPQKHPDVNTP